ncbi:hypothetical protein COO60DRAFT_296509 [Scenedesmus sp. NREL 46B-D3]|nr:hypothetical protein COO60DRAFT_296509 [Scenedesmus sp. NREL 46B-D3]
MHELRSSLLFSSPCLLRCLPTLPACRLGSATRHPWSSRSWQHWRAWGPRRPQTGRHGWRPSLRHFRQQPAAHLCLCLGQQQSQALQRALVLAAATAVRWLALVLRCLACWALCGAVCCLHPTWRTSSQSAATPAARASGTSSPASCLGPAALPAGRWWCCCRRRMLTWRARRGWCPLWLTCATACAAWAWSVRCRPSCTSRWGAPRAECQAGDGLLSWTWCLSSELVAVC